MSKFALKSIEAIGNAPGFMQLVIFRNTDEIIQESIELEEGVMDIFETSIQKSDQPSLVKILTYMDILINNPAQLLPKTKYNTLTPKKDPVAEYEFKHGRLRVYGITTIDMKRVIVHCGYKNKQSEDMTRFRSLKKQFLDQY